MNRNLFTLLIVMVLMTIVVSNAQSQYVLREIPSFGGQTKALDVNNNDVVVGHSYDASNTNYHAFSYNNGELPTWVLLED